MGTRADFYVGIGPTAKWLGSISYDGDPSGTPKPVLESKSEQEFRARVRSMILRRSIGPTTRPSEGWPWPWDDSRTTDYAYAWCDNQLPAVRGKVMISRFGGRWVASPMDIHDAYYDAPKLTDAEVVNMAARRANRDTVVGKSGLLIFVPRR